jgi:hypothetical protein
VLSEIKGRHREGRPAPVLYGRLIMAGSLGEVVERSLVRPPPDPRFTCGIVTRSSTIAFTEQVLPTGAIAPCALAVTIFGSGTASKSER